MLDIPEVSRDSAGGVMAARCGIAFTAARRTRGDFAALVIAWNSKQSADCPADFLSWRRGQNSRELSREKTLPDS
jgi:hypothetical protein